VWTVHEAVEIQDEEEVRDILRDEGFDLRHRTFLLGAAPRLEGCEGTDQVQLLERNSGSLTIQADMKCQGMVVIGDSYFPGWQATVDGKPVEIYEAYAAVRGVVVDAGRHEIEMKYRPRSAYLGLLMTALGLLGLFAVELWSRRRERSSEK
jgi:uncharacterized membrane protein YfhO